MGSTEMLKVKLLCELISECFFRKDLVKVKVY